MMEIKRVLITGVNGFVGKRTAIALIKQGFAVYGLSMDSNCHVTGMAGYVSIPIENQEAVYDYVQQQKFDAVVHLAAIVHKRTSDLTERAYDQVNHLASANLFQACADAGVKRVLFASTIEVHGNRPETHIDETTPAEPTTFYGRSKLAAEKALERAAKDGMDYAIMRLAPVYASQFRMNVDKRVYLSNRMAAYYFKKGDYSFHFLSIDNLVDGIVALLKAEKTEGIYFMADKNPVSARELIRLEKAHNGLKRAFRIPYIPAYIGIFLVDQITRLFGPRDSFFSLYNFRKIFRSAQYDISRIAELTQMDHDVSSTLYKEEEGLI